MDWRSFSSPSASSMVAELVSPRMDSMLMMAVLV